MRGNGIGWLIHKAAGTGRGRVDFDELRTALLLKATIPRQCALTSARPAQKHPTG
jgi:hypothetical protein